LVAYTFKVETLLPPDKEKLNSPSKTVRNQGWFQFAWDQDPTIKSMLNMLDSIHLKFSNRPDFYALLVRLENPVITFFLLNLKEFKSTDDLYIKMNSRGVALTPFENFKAKFEQHIGNSKELKKRSFSLQIGEEVGDVFTQEYFSYSIDTKWANLFWNYRGVGTKENSFDDEFMNFIRVILSNQYALNLKSESDETLDYLMGAKDKNFSGPLSYHKFEKTGALTDGAILSLIDSFNALANGNQPIKAYLQNSFYFNEDETFKNVISHTLTLTQRVRFFAYTSLLIQNNGPSIVCHK